MDLLSLAAIGNDGCELQLGKSKVNFIFKFF